MKNNTDRIKKIVMIAMFSAIAFVTTVLCGYFPKVAGFLSLEVKDAVIVLCSLLLGPLSGFVIAILVPIVESFTISATGWYGLIMNALSSATFVLVTSTIYKYKRTFYGAIAGLLAGIFSVTAVMLLANLFITPLYLRYMLSVPATMNTVVEMIPTILLPFNFIKATLNAALVLLLYKPVSTALKKMRVLECTESIVAKNTNSKYRSAVVTAISIVIIVLSFVVIFFVLKA